MPRLTYIFLSFPVLLSLTAARPTYPDLVPNGRNSDLPCLHLGHIDCIPGGPRNQFGLAFAAAGRQWTPELCAMDSDGDGLTNGEELGDPCCTWTPASGDDGLRTDNLSHPGDEDRTEARGQPGCPTGSPTAGANATATATATPASATTAATTTAATTPAAATPAAEVTQTSAPADDAADASATPNPAEQAADEAAECFPGDATVTLKDGSTALMSDLKVGDEVLAKFPDVYSKIYIFSHKEQDSVNDFMKIKAANGLSITATRGHYIVVNGNLKAAAAVAEGDIVHTKNGDAKVVDVEAVKMTGLYNPHTLVGSIVVDGVLASDVTTAVKPSVARMLLAPFKFMYGVLERDVSGGFLNNGWVMVAQVMPAGSKEL